MALEADIEKYLKDAKVDTKDIVKAMRSSFELVAYGEMHVGLERKAEFFARLIKDQADRFHASEHFHNTVEYGDAVEKYLDGKAASSSLPSGVRQLTTVLDAIKPRTSTTGVVFSGIKSGSNRDKLIFENFKASFGLHLKAKRFAKGDPGHFHIGAAHGGRLPLGGSTPTTTQLLIKDGFNVGTVRILVDVSGSASGMPSGGMGTVFTAGESVPLTPVSGGDPIELIDIVKRVAGGNPFGADLRKKPNPFAKVRPDESTSSDGYDKYFDALIYLA